MPRNYSAGKAYSRFVQGITSDNQSRMHNAPVSHDLSYHPASVYEKNKERDRIADEVINCIIDCLRCPE